MKKLLLAALVVMGTLSYGRDFEYGEKRDIQGRSAKYEENLERPTLRKIELGGKSEDINFERYSRFHRELERAEKGHEKK